MLSLSCGDAEIYCLDSLGLDGSEEFTIAGTSEEPWPGKMLSIAPGGKNFTVKCRVDTPQAVKYRGTLGILPRALLPMTK
ncbi:MAG: hypothetical protein GY811_29125 [Myxococcales bacterium]|nr:hypothetical protein [Myxococcales bacterium]